MSDDPQNPLTPSYTLCSRLNPTAQSPTDHSIRRGLSVPCKGKSFTCKNFNSIDHLVIFNFACYSQLLTKLRSIPNLLHNQLLIPPLQMHLCILCINTFDSQPPEPLSPSLRYHLSKLSNFPLSILILPLYHSTHYPSILTSYTLYNTLSNTSI